MVTQILFTVLLILLAIQRLAELRLSRRNEAKILSQGGREYGSKHFPFMQALHISWFIAALFEVFVFQRPFIPALFGFAIIFLILGQTLRYAAIRTLGPRWSVRIMIEPGVPPVEAGIYRYIRHPNYLGVILEIFAVPLLHTAYLTAIIFSLLNGFILFTRIRAEEQALGKESSYTQVFTETPRFMPSRRSASIQKQPGGHEKS